MQPIPAISRPSLVLRRRFDSLKWDVKKCEDIVFDLQVGRRLGLLPALFNTASSEYQNFIVTIGRVT
jgi:hypothetical protein